MRRVLTQASALMPMVFAGGCLMAYQFGVFPLALERADVGACFVVFGVGSVLGAVLCGRLVTVLGERRYRQLTLGLAYVSLALAFPIAVAAGDESLPRIGLQHPAQMVLPAVAAASFGLSDSAIAVLAYTDLSRRFRTRASSARAGAARQLFYSLGFLVGFGVGPYVPAVWQLCSLAFLLLLAWRSRERAVAW